jgi:hypothetical protein
MLMWFNQKCFRYSFRRIIILDERKIELIIFRTAPPPPPKEVFGSCFFEEVVEMLILYAL